MSYTGQATVCTPLLWGSRAIELANRTWHKRILPVGDIEYQGRMLHFTRDYLAGLVKAFNSKAYDQVSFQLADSKNAHTNDPERHRGTITGLELADDGLYATAQVTEAGERILAENPQLGVSARIVENYSRSDGKFYPAAIQHVLGTLDPRIPALGQWEPISLSNSGGLVIDLTGSTWAGEPGAPLPAAGELSDAELADFIDAITEADAEEAAAYGLPPQFADFDQQFTASYAAEAQREQARQAADLEDAMRKPGRIGHESEHDRLARSLSRISADTYDTSHAASFASPSREAIELSTELTMATGQGLCGDPDPFGRCSSRYHDLLCASSVSVDWSASSPPRSTYEASLSNFAAGHDLGGTPASYGDGDEQHPIPQRTLELAHRLNQSWGLSPAPTLDELTGPLYGSRTDAYAAMAAELGRPDLSPQPDLPGDYPDVSAIRRGLGV